MPVGGLVRLIPRAGAEAELLERALDIAEDVRGEPGNLMTIMLRDPAQPTHVLMFELFADQAAIEAHRVASHSLEKGPAVRALLEVPMQVQPVETLD